VCVWESSPANLAPEQQRGMKVAGQNVRVVESALSLVGCSMTETCTRGPYSWDFLFFILLFL
jgi:hypothetical protein